MPTIYFYGHLCSVSVISKKTPFGDVGRPSLGCRSTCIRWDIRLVTVSSGAVHQNVRVKW